MSLKQWFSALLFAGFVCSLAYSQAKAPEDKAAEKLAVPPSDFSKEAYVIEKSYSRIRVENDGTGTRELTVDQDPGRRGREDLRCAELHVYQRE